MCLPVSTVCYDVGIHGICAPHAQVVVSAWHKRQANLIQQLSVLIVSVHFKSCRPVGQTDIITCDDGNYINIFNCSVTN